MLAFLREITVTCFFCSYIVVLLIELSRLWRRVPGRGLLVILSTCLGLFAHFSYLVMRASQSHAEDLGILASWLDWSLILSFILGVTFLIFFIRRPDTIVGFFFLPAILILITVDPVLHVLMLVLLMQLLNLMSLTEANVFLITQ